MGRLESIIRGVVYQPRKIMIYGVHGVGKSTFAAGAPKPIFIQTEDGLANIDCAKFPVSKSYDDVIENLRAIHDDDHKFETLAIDSLDWLERLIWDKVCKDKNVSSIDEIGYAKGYGFAMSHWKKIFEALDAIRAKRKMLVVLIAHAKVERHEDPETEGYDRFAPRLHKSASGLVQEWADEVMFANFKVYTKKSGEGFNEKTKAIGGEERILRTQYRPAAVAKTRCVDLPFEIPLDWNSYYTHIKEKK